MGNEAVLNKTSEVQVRKMLRENDEVVMLNWIWDVEARAPNIEDGRGRTESGTS